MEPACTVGLLELERGHRLDERQMAGVADGAAVLSPAVMPVAGRRPSALRGQKTIPDQEYQRQLSEV